MKVSVHIDFDFDVRAPRWLRRALLLGIPVAAMAITSSLLAVPNTFASNDPLSSSKMNENFEDLDKRSTTAWTPYACKPVDRVTEMELGPPGSYASKCLYRTVGDSLEVRITSQFTSAPTPGYIVAWTLPEGVTVDQAKLPIPNSYRNVLGIASSGVGSTQVGVVATNLGKSSVVIALDEGADALNSSAIGGGHVIALDFTAPIAVP